MYYITIRHPKDEWPHTIIYNKQEYDDGEIAPAPGTEWMLVRGDFPGEATISLSAPPAFSPHDRVAVYLLGDPPDDPTYLGEASGEPWEVGQGSIKCTPLKDSVALAAWRGDVVGGVVQPLSATVKPYVEGMLMRSVLADDLAVGDLADLPTLLRSRNPFELIGDAMKVIEPVIGAGTWGVTSKLRLALRVQSETLNYRFLHGEAELTPGTTTGYANCIRFPFTRPDQTQSFFEFRVLDEVEGKGIGEIWLQDSLPAIVEAARFRLPASTPVTVTGYIGYDGDVLKPTGENAVTVSALMPALNPAWSGTFADLWTGRDIAPRYGLDARLPYADTEATFELPNDTLTETYALIVFAYSEPGLRLRLKEWSNDPWVVGSAASAEGEFVQFYLANRLRVGYHPDDWAAYVAAHGQNPRGIRFRLSNQSHLVGNGTNSNIACTVQATYRVGVNASPEQSLVTSLVVNLAANEVQDVVPPAPTVENRVDLTLPETTWLQGSGVSVHLGIWARLTNASQTLNLSPPTFVNDGGEQKIIFGVPEDFTATGLILFGELDRMGYVDIAGVDYAPMTLYAQGKLRYLIQPVRAWKGTLRGLRDERGSVPQRWKASGVAAFSTASGQDVLLDVQLLRYNLDDNLVILEAGTPQAPDDDRAVADAIENVKRDVRKAG